MWKHAYLQKLFQIDVKDTLCGIGQEFEVNILYVGN